MATYYIAHSAKGTTWKNHKYIKKINGVYYYAKDAVSKAKNTVSNLGIAERKQLADAAQKTRSTSVTSNPYTSESYYEYDKNGNLVYYDKENYVKYLDKQVDEAAKKYSNTLLSKVEAKYDIVNKVLDEVMGSTEEGTELHENRHNSSTSHVIKSKRIN